MMAWTNPKTWTTEVLTSNNMNTYVRDNTDYIYDNFILSNQWFNVGTSVSQNNIRIESGQEYIGITTSTYGSIQVTFASEFGTAPRVLVTEGSMTNAPTQAKSIATTGFKLYVWNGSGGTMSGSACPSWLAIGA
jgi:hypothetical protein